MRRDGSDTYDMVIAGGSFVGLALALALARSAPRGFRLAVVDATPPEQARAASADGRASAISLASRRLLEAIDVWPMVAGAAEPVRDIEISDTPLTNALRPALLHFDTHLSEGAPAAQILENHVLRGALLDTVLETDQIVLLAPAEVVGHAVDAHGVSVELVDGESLRARLIVAADGRRSALRRRAGIKTVGWRYSQLGITTTVAHERDHEGRAVQHFLPAGPFAILPLPGRRSSLVWTEEQERGEAIMALDDDDFLEEVTRRFGHRLGCLRIAGPRVAYPLTMHVARRFFADRVALAGDAAHGLHPLAGQGLNVGLRDVAALAEVVVEAARLGLDIGSAPVLERYERWRRFDTVLSTVAMDGLNRLFSNDVGPLRALRGIGLGLVDRLPALKQGFVEEAAGITGELPRLLKGEPV